MANQLLTGNAGKARVASDFGLNSLWVKRGLAAGLAAMTAALITACGGGGAAAPTTVGGDLQVLPGTTDMYANTPVTFTISGGQRPYTVFSSNSSILPLNLTVSSGTTFVATANNPATDTSVVITVRDSAGVSATATASVRSTVLLNAITVRSSTGAGNICGGANVCSGSDAVASVTARQNDIFLVGRQIRFDIVSGVLGILSGATTVSSLTVPTDSFGVALVTLRAPISVPSQYTVLRATDVTSGQSASHVLTVGQTVDPTAIKIIPESFAWTGAFKDSCANGALTSHLVTGGTPPYTVRQSIPDFSVIAGSPLAPQSVPVPANGTTLGINGGSILVVVTGAVCSIGANGNTITVTDAIGRVATFSMGNAVGTLDRPPAGTAVALPVPTLAPAAFTGLGCGVAFSSFVSQTIPAGYTGTAPVLSVVALEPLRVDAQFSSGIITVTRRVTDPGGGATTLVRVSNGVNFADLSITLTGVAPFTCVAGGTTTAPIVVNAGVPLVLSLATELGRSKSSTISGGRAPFTLTSKSPTIVLVSKDGVTYSTAITIAAGEALVYFVRATGVVPGGTQGQTFIEIVDSSVPAQTAIQIVTVGP